MLIGLIGYSTNHVWISMRYDHKSYTPVFPPILAQIWVVFSHVLLASCCQRLLLILKVIADHPISSDVFWPMIHDNMTNLGTHNVRHVLIQDGDRGLWSGGFGSAATAVPWFLQMAGHPIQPKLEVCHIWSLASPGYCRLLQVTAGYCRLLQVTAGYCRLLQVTAGYCRCRSYFEETFEHRLGND